MMRQTNTGRRNDEGLGLLHEAHRDAGGLRALAQRDRRDQRDRGIRHHGRLDFRGVTFQVYHVGTLVEDNRDREVPEALRDFRDTAETSAPRYDDLILIRQVA